MFCHMYMFENCGLFKASWAVSVELVIGPDVGISYVTDKLPAVSMIFWLLAVCCVQPLLPFYCYVEPVSSFSRLIL